MGMPGMPGMEMPGMASGRIPPGWRNQGGDKKKKKQKKKKGFGQL
jgi:signal recognition particle subunit SRP54